MGKGRWGGRAADWMPARSDKGSEHSDGGLPTRDEKAPEQDKVETPARLQTGSDTGRHGGRASVKAGARDSPLDPSRQSPALRGGPNNSNVRQKAEQRKAVKESKENEKKKPPAKDARMYPNYTLKDLEKWVAEGTVSGETLEKVKKEIEARKNGASQTKVTPQVGWGKK